jgi:hypothetical protein
VLNVILAVHFDLEHLAVPKDLELNIDYSRNSFQPSIELLLFLTSHLINIDN